MVPGEMFAAAGEVVLNKDSKAISLKVGNTEIDDTSRQSYHFAETNAALAFNREAALGTAGHSGGTAVRFEPGQSRQIWLVPIEARVWFTDSTRR